MSHPISANVNVNAGEVTDVSVHCEQSNDEWTLDLETTSINNVYLTGTCDELERLGIAIAAAARRAHGQGCTDREAMERRTARAAGFKAFGEAS